MNFNTTHFDNVFDQENRILQVKRECESEEEDLTFVEPPIQTQPTRKRGRPSKTEWSRTWSDNETLQLIAIWQQHQNLYDTKNKAYFNKDIRQYTLDLVVQLLKEKGIEVESKQVAKKLTDLKNYYGSQRRMAAEAAAEVEGCYFVTTSPWRFYQHLHFLNDAFTPRKAKPRETTHVDATETVPLERIHQNANQLQFIDQSENVNAFINTQTKMVSSKAPLTLTTSYRNNPQTQTTTAFVNETFATKESTNNRPYQNYVQSKTAANISQTKEPMHHSLQTHQHSYNNIQSSKTTNISDKVTEPPNRPSNLNPSNSKVITLENTTGTGELSDNQNPGNSTATINTTNQKVDSAADDSFCNLLKVQLSLIPECNAKDDLRINMHQMIIKAKREILNTS